MPPSERKCLVVAAHFPPLGGGGVIRITNFVLGLAASGWHVTVLTPDPTWAISTGGWAIDESLHERVKEAGVVLALVPYRSATASLLTSMRYRSGDRSPLPRAVRLASRLGFAIAEKTSSLIRNLLFIDEYCGWGISAAMKVIRLRTGGYRPDVVISTSPPHSVQVTGRVAARFFGVPFVADLRDQWSDNPHPLIAGKRRLNRWLERGVVGRACAVTVTTSESRAHLVSNSSADPASVLVVPNGYDGEAWEAVSATPEEGKFVLTYVGTLGHPRDPWALAEAVERLAREVPGFLKDFTLRLVGPVSAESRSRLHAVMGDSLDVVGSVSQAESLVYMARSHWLLVILFSGEGAETAIPGKIYEYVAARRPLLAMVGEGAAERLIRDLGVGLVVPPDDPSAIADALRAIFSAWRSRSSDKLVRMPDAETVARFDRRTSVRAFEEAVARCAGVEHGEGH